MKIVGLDLETTGLSYEDGHRIIEVGMVKVEYDTATFERKVIDKMVLRIHPNRTISADAQAVHGISLSDLVGCKQFAAHAADIVQFLSDAGLLVGHNLINFDAPFLAFELMAAGQTPPGHLQMADTMEARWATPHGKLPNLGELCYALEVPYDPSAAHSAEYDIEKTLDCFFTGHRLGWFKLPEGVAT